MAYVATPAQILREAQWHGPVDEAVGIRLIRNLKTNRLGASRYVVWQFPSFSFACFDKEATRSIAAHMCWRSTS